jgi:toxin ParE1/3/4
VLPLRWTERAVTDLAGIAEYISRTSAIYAEGVVAQIDHRLQLLREHPHMGKPAPEAEDLAVRELVIESHRVFYRVRPDAIDLLAIVHGRQQTPREF